MDAITKEAWTVWSLDVWGNDKEGYEINDRSTIGSVEIPADATDKQVIKALVDAEYLKPRFRFDIDGDDTVLYVEYKGRPVLQLEKDI